jgi:hypothetical protein
METILITPDNSIKLFELKEFLRKNNIKSNVIETELLEDILFNQILIDSDKSEEVSEDVIFKKLLK